MRVTPTVAALLSLAGALPCFAQLPLVQITGFDPGGTLSWTNRLCTSQPVYEVLRASAIAGPWERIAMITNQTMFTPPHGVTQSSGVGFVRLAWTEDAPLLLDYAYDEGYGLTAVQGRLSVSLSGQSDMGFWSCQETPLALDGLQPTGVGSLRGGAASVTLLGEHRVRLYLTTPGGEGAVYLEGTLQRGEVGGRCAYTGIVGTVNEVRFGSSENIGTFTAIRAP